MRSRKPVSRIDSDDTHGCFARVYRVGWSRGKMFSDSVCGGRAEAERNAWTWQKRVDAQLPKTPRKPVLKKATFRLRKGPGGRYYDVYLPMPGRAKPKSLQLFCNDLRNLERQGEKAYKLVKARNALLEASYRLAYAAWKREHARRIAQIEAMWKKVKEA